MILPLKAHFQMHMWPDMMHAGDQRLWCTGGMLQTAMMLTSMLTLHQRRQSLIGASEVVLTTLRSLACLACMYQDTYSTAWPANYVTRMSTTFAAYWCTSVHLDLVCMLHVLTICSAMCLSCGDVLSSV